MKSNAANAWPESLVNAQVLSLKNSAIMLMKKIRFEQALNILNEAMYLNSTVKEIQFLRAVCLWHLFCRDEALLAAKGELLNNPESDNCLEFLNMRCQEPIRRSQRSLLCKNERRFFSQNGEDGILEFIFQAVGFHNRTFLEIGCGDGTECNTAYLSLLHGWSGTLIESKHKSAEFAQKYYQNLPINIVNSSVTVENIDDIIHEVKTEKDLDLLSIDIDGNDYWIWKAIKKSEPRVVVIEYNASLGSEKSIAIEYEEDFKWDGSLYFGASISALANLANNIGYHLVGCDSCGVNAFFIRKNINSRKLQGVEPIDAYYSSLYHLSQFGISLSDSRNWITI